jgi:hypothetical protein
VYLVVGSIALFTLGALDIPALHVLDPEWSWAKCIAVGAGLAAVGAICALAWFGASSWFDVKYYFWKRVIALMCATALFATALHFVMSWPLLPTFAGGLALAFAGMFALLLATGDL